MARAERRRVERPKQAPGPERERAGRRAPKPEPALEDTLFFNRLRRQAKWVFVLLALAFALTFVVFGVGSGGSGLGDVLFQGDGGAGTDGVPSVGKAREAVEKNPRSAEAHYQLSQALQQEGETEEAIAALERYVELRPSDRTKLEELASLYLSDAQKLATQAQQAQLESQTASGEQIFGLNLQGAKKEPVALGDPAAPSVEEAVSTKANARFTEKYSELTARFGEAQRTYEKIVQLAPRDPSAQINLAQAAQRAGDTRTAITAYERALKLAPDAPEAPIIREQLTQLRASVPPASTG